MVSIAAAVVTGIGAIIGLTAGLVGFLVLPSYIEKQIIESVQLFEGTEAFDRWETLPLPVVYKVYFFNVTNPDDITDGAQPVVNEIGPYVYNQYRTKVNITREDDILSYYQYQHFEFDEEASAPLTEYDDLTIVNLPLMSIASVAEYTAGSSLLTLIALNAAIPTLFSSPTSVFTATTPRDFLFDGEYVLCNTTNILFTTICDTIEAETTVTMPRLEDGRFRFTFFGHKNASHDGYYSINSGTTDVSQLGEIVAWENSTTLDTWAENTTCNDIYGCDSSLYPPFATEESQFNIFTTDICRTAAAYYAGETEYSGIDARRYSPDENLFASPSNYSANECYCLNRTEGIRGDDGCLLDGAMELWDCVGSPVVLTLPHFHQANEVYQTGVDGVYPNESLHGMYMDLEPLSGILLRGSRKAQFNMFLRPINRITLTTNLPTTLMPIVWVDEGVELTDELIAQLNSQLFDKLKLISYVKWVGIIGGIVIFTAGLIWLIISIVKSKQIH